MKKLLLLLFIGSYFQSHAQGWLKSFGFPFQQVEDKFLFVYPLTDTTFMAVADSMGTNIAYAVTYSGDIVNISRHRNPSWSYKFGHYRLRKKDNGYLRLARQMLSAGPGYFSSLNYFEICTDAGEALWGGEVTGDYISDYHILDGIYNLQDSTMVSVGWHKDADGTKLHFRSTKANGYYGQEQWTKDLVEPGKDLRAWRMFPADNGNFLVYNDRSWLDTSYHYESGFALFNSTGDLLSQNWLPLSTFPIGFELDFKIADGPDGYLVYVNGGLYKTDINGVFQWKKLIQSPLEITNIKRVSDGYIGVFQSHNTLNGYDFLSIKFDLGGEIVWQKKIHYNKNDQFNDIIPAPDSGYIAVGFTGKMQANTHSDYCIARLNNQGDIFSNQITGVFYNDINANCTREPSEPIFSDHNFKAVIDAGQLFHLSSRTGQFDVRVDTGDYSIHYNKYPGAYWKACQDSVLGHFGGYFQADTIDIGFTALADCPQMDVRMSINKIRPCSQSWAQIYYANIGSAMATDAYLTLQLPPTEELLGSQLPNTDEGNGLYRFELGNVAAGTQTYFLITLGNSCALQLGDTVCLTAQVFPSDTCVLPPGVAYAAPFHFVENKCMITTNSFDPNEKEAFPIGAGDAHYIPADTVLQYQISFQNTGTDTAFAVVIRDTLSPFLDPISVIPGLASHPYRFEYQQDGSLKFVFAPIMLPDSNSNEQGSHGFVQFDVRMRKNLPPLTAIHNTAAIFFDYNSAIYTNTVTRTIEQAVSTNVPSQLQVTQVKIHPNPARQHALLSFFLPQPAKLTVDLWNIKGEKILQIADCQLFEKGKNEVKLDLPNLPSGTYQVRLSDGQNRIKAVGLMVLGL